MGVFDFDFNFDFNFNLFSFLYLIIRKIIQELVPLMKEREKEIQDQMKGFSALYKSSTSNITLSRKIKELIALGISITVRCDGCIAFFVNDAVNAGCTREEIMETIGVVVMIGDDPAEVYGGKAMEGLNQIVE